MDAFDISQSIKNRLLIAIPILIIAYFITYIDFALVWRYFSFSNMLLSTSVLWLASIYLINRKAIHWVTSIPATFASFVSLSYIFHADIGFNLEHGLANILAILGSAALLGLILLYQKSKHS